LGIRSTKISVIGAAMRPAVVNRVASTTTLLACVSRHPWRRRGPMAIGEKRLLAMVAVNYPLSSGVIRVLSLEDRDEVLRTSSEMYSPWCLHLLVAHLAPLFFLSNAVPFEEEFIPHLKNRVVPDLGPGAEAML